MMQAKPLRTHLLSTGSKFLTLTWLHSINKNTIKEFNSFQITGFFGLQKTERHNVSETFQVPQRQKDHPLSKNDC